MDVDPDEAVTPATTTTTTTTSSSPSHGIDRFSRLPPELQRCIFFLVKHESDPNERALRRPICNALLAQQRAALYHSIELRSWAQFEALFYTTLRISPGLGGLVKSLKVNPKARYLEMKEIYKGAVWDRKDRSEPEDVEIFPERDPMLRQDEILAGFRVLTGLKSLSWVGDPGEEDEEADGAEEADIDNGEGDRFDGPTADDDDEAQDPSDLLSIILSNEFSRSCAPSLHRFQIVFPAESRVTPRQLARLAPHPSLRELAFIIPSGDRDEPKWNQTRPKDSETSLPNVKKVTIAGKFSSSRLLDFAVCFTHAENIYLCPEKGDSNLVPYTQSLSTQVSDLAIVCSQYVPWNPRPVDVFDKTLARFKRLRQLTLDGEVQLPPVFWDSIVQLPLLESIVFEEGTEPRYQDLAGFLTSPQRPVGVLQMLALDQYRRFRMGWRLEVGDANRINDYFARCNDPSLNVATMVPLVRGWVMPEWREGFMEFKEAEKLLGLIGKTGVRITGSFYDALITTKVFMMLWEQVRKAEEDGGLLGPDLEALPNETDEQCFNRYGMIYIPVGRQGLGSNAKKLVWMIRTAPKEVLDDH
ncbi:BQ2448_3324 [Microbotryum intermedium]|uniref:BQ2448_3324 protein n=1 Tax=Microbotryum intermedium TaxID=269621 RepID=A0A238F9L7_9BASI|nr:BQ2448_3324 [Microbotryum intermedium]